MNPQLLAEQEISKKWQEYKAKFNKNYDDPTEDEQRKQLFINTLKFITNHNEKFKKGLTTYQCGLNQFSDLTPEEQKFRTAGVHKQQKQ